MITEVSVSGLRGIQEGSLKELTPLVVLVGPNGCGKSTLIDALLIGGGSNPGSGVGRAVFRRSNSWNGSRWLFWRQNPNRIATINVKAGVATGEATRHTSLKWVDTPNAALTTAMKTERTSEPPYTGIQVTSIWPADDAYGGPRFSSTIDVCFSGSNHYNYDLIQERCTSTPAPPHLIGLLAGWEVRLIDSPKGIHQPLDEAYSAAVEAGRKDMAVGALKSVLGPDFTDLTLLTDHRVPVVHLVFKDGSVPVTVAGEGIASLVRIALELAGRRGGTALLEEPETHQHLRMLLQTAQVIWATILHDVQVVLTTHSLELIDALIATAPTSHLDKLTVFRLKVEEGKLLSTRISGTDAAAMRADFEDDLR